MKINGKPLQAWGSGVSPSYQLTGNILICMLRDRSPRVCDAQSCHDRASVSEVRSNAGSTRAATDLSRDSSDLHAMPGRSTSDVSCLLTSMVVSVVQPGVNGEVECSKLMCSLGTSTVASDPNKTESGIEAPSLSNCHAEHFVAHRPGSWSRSCRRDAMPPWTVARTCAYSALHAGASEGLTSRLSIGSKNLRCMGTWYL